MSDEMDKIIVENPPRTKDLTVELIAVWEESVTATHTFLNEKQINELRPLVEEGIKEIDKLLVIFEKNKAVGFMGIDDTKIEMLFLKPLYIGKGLGKRLVLKAVNDYEVVYVDVNEQNPNALAFYKKFDFMVVERLELDEQGNPFPILKLKLNKELDD